jgi:hypothetical protein
VIPLLGSLPSVAAVEGETYQARAHTIFRSSIL